MARLIYKTFLGNDEEILRHITWEERLTRELLVEDDETTWVGLVLTTTVLGDPATDVTTTPAPPGTGTTLLLIRLSMADVLLLLPAFLCWKFSIIAATSLGRPLVTPFATTAPSGVAVSSEPIPLIVGFSTGNSDIFWKHLEKEDTVNNAVTFQVGTHNTLLFIIFFFMISNYLLSKNGEIILESIIRTKPKTEKPDGQDNRYSRKLRTSDKSSVTRLVSFTHLQQRIS